MASDDVQIVVAGTASAPLAYTVPNAQEIQPLAVNATFDGSGAAGDYKPTLEIVGKGGVIVARIPSDDVITAGSNAEITWAPFLRSRATGAAAVTFDWAHYYDDGGGTPAGASGVVYALNTFGGATFWGTAFDNPAPPQRLTGLKTGMYLCTARCEWNASFAGDRYLQITGTTAFGATNQTAPVWTRTAVTPDGDVMTVSAAYVLDAIGAAPLTFGLNVYQASGVAQTLKAGAGWIMQIVYVPLTGI